MIILMDMLFLIMTYMFFLMYISSAFLRYDLRRNGYYSPAGTFISKNVVKYYVKRKPLMIEPLTKIGFSLYNLYHRLTVSLNGISKIERIMYRFGLYFYKNMIFKIGYGLLFMFVSGVAITKGPSFIKLIFSLMVLMNIVTYVYCVIEPVVKSKDKLYRHMFINYLLLFNNGAYWKQKTFLKRFQYQLNVNYKSKSNYQREWKQMSDYEASSDQSSFNLKYRNGELIKLPAISTVILAFAKNNQLEHKNQCMGGTNFYHSVDFMKIDDRSFAKSNGMSTYLDYDDLIPKGYSLRDVDSNKALNIRRKSKVPGLYQDSKRVFDRTHLVHHRLSGCEGGIGAMVPMFKSVNTGINSMFHGRVTNTPVKNSMKYYEDFAINYLSEHKTHRLLYEANPFYIKPNDVVPSHVRIMIYCITDDKVFLIKHGKVYNQQYLFSKDRDVKFKVDTTTGHVTYR